MSEQTGMDSVRMGDDDVMTRGRRCENCDIEEPLNMQDVDDYWRKEEGAGVTGYMWRRKNREGRRIAHHR